MARNDLGRTSHSSPTGEDTMDQDDRVRGRADEMEDASRDEDFEDTDDLNDEDEDEGEGEGSF
jgi:hypothetical protein